MPFVFLLISVFYYEQHFLVLEMSAYISIKVRSLVTDVAGGEWDDRLIGWESYRRWRTSRVFSYASHVVRLLATLGPAPVCFVVGLLLAGTRSSHFHFYWWLDATFAVDGILLFALVYLLLSLNWSFNRLRFIPGRP